MTEHLFAYGTLLPGDVRWHFLQPFVVDDGVVDQVPGLLFDTGEGYPAAVFDPRADPGADPGLDPGSDRRVDDAVIHGRVFTFVADRLAEALELLDEVEGAVAGDYRRVRVVTASGVRAWAYAVGGGLPLDRIVDGRWPSDRSRPLGG